MAKISVVINTLNEEKNIKKALNSVKWADEIVVCDMYSEDKTAEIANRLGAKVVYHKKAGYVEPARNFAVSKATSEWILILDADEEIPDSLADRLKDIADKMEHIDYVKIPRKNIIFGRWMRASMWWPDYNIRFFRKGSVHWSDEIHRPPKTEGMALKLDEDEKWAIIHYNYATISQYIERMSKYSEIQAKELVNDGVKFNWADLIHKPLSEFLSRFFASGGYQDGLHGLGLSLLQASSFLIVYLRVWEMEKFKQEELRIKDIEQEAQKAGEEISYWFKYVGAAQNPFKKFVQKIRSKF